MDLRQGLFSICHPLPAGGQQPGPVLFKAGHLQMGCRRNDNGAALGYQCIAQPDAGVIDAMAAVQACGKGRVLTEKQRIEPPPPLRPFDIGLRPGSDDNSPVAAYGQGALQRDGVGCPAVRIQAALIGYHGRKAGHGAGGPQNRGVAAGKMRLVKVYGAAGKNIGRNGLKLRG